jgi:hypothetical protein
MPALLLCRTLISDKNSKFSLTALGYRLGDFLDDFGFALVCLNLKKLLNSLLAVTFAEFRLLLFLDLGFCLNEFGGSDLLDTVFLG